MRFVRTRVDRSLEGRRPRRLATTRDINHVEAFVPAAGEACKVSPDCIHIFIGIGSSQFEVLGTDLNELGASSGGETELSDGGISVVDESGVLEFVYSYELSC